MPLQTDTSLSFTSSTGYTQEDDYIEFASGVARLNSGTFAGGVAWLLTPAIPTVNGTTWTAIHRVAVTATEAPDYRHKFMLSIDGGTTWMTYGAQGWIQRTDFNEIAIIQEDETLVGIGMGIDELEAIRRWPAIDAASSIVFAIAFCSANMATEGTMNQITIHYLDDGGLEESELAPGGEPATQEGETLDGMVSGTSGRMLTPHYPLAVTVIWPCLQGRSVDGERYAWAMGSEPREAVRSAIWSGLSAAERDEVLVFLRAHRDAGFQWTRPGASAPANWIVTEPQFEPTALGTWRVTADIFETLGELIPE